MPGNFFAFLAKFAVEVFPDFRAEEKRTPGPAKLAKKTPAGKLGATSGSIDFHHHTRVDFSHQFNLLFHNFFGSRVPVITDRKGSGCKSRAAAQL
jgi:hypothetical protein